jgi:hypothetical protein
MRTPLLIFAFCTSSFLTVVARDFPGPDGSTWRNVSIYSWDAESVTFAHDSVAITRLTIKDIPDELRQAVAEAIEEARRQSVPTPAPESNQPLTARNVMVKHVMAEGFFGGQTAKYRYFFAIKNLGASEFSGTVNITLLNKEPGITNGSEDFTLRIAPGITKIVYIDAFTGPARVHGDACVANFQMTRGTGADAPKARGAITAEFEDLVGVGR